jgi:hypothetical protein
METVEDMGTASPVLEPVATAEAVTNNNLNPPTGNKKNGLWGSWRKNNNASSEGGEKSKTDAHKDQLPPVPLTQLYRFHTRLEIFLNFVGLACAMATGTAQVSRFELSRSITIFY